MRSAVFIVALVALGCAPPTDPTPNRAAPTSGDYPAGPYGYARGSVMANLTFLGKSAPAPTDYSTLPMTPTSLADLRKNAQLIVLDRGARWCTDCNNDMPAFKELEADYGPRGVAVLDVLAQGGVGTTATEDDINRWANAYALAGNIAIDPEQQLARYVDVDAYPVYIVVRASTMTIEYMKADPLSLAPLGPVLDSLLAQ